MIDINVWLNKVEQVEFTRNETVRLRFKEGVTMTLFLGYNEETEQAGQITVNSLRQALGRLAAK